MRKVCLVILVLFFLQSLVYADDKAKNKTEFNFLASASIGASNGLGYKPPSISFAAGPEIKNKHFLLALRGDYNLANKVQTNDGYSWSVGGEVYFRQKNLFFGGGWRHGCNQTSLWRKCSARPLASFGFEKNLNSDFGRNEVPAKLFIDWIPSGSDKSNRLHGFRVRPEIDIKKNWRIGGHIGVWWFHPTLRPDLPWIVAPTIGGGLTYVF